VVWSVFEAAETKHTLSEEAYKQQVPTLRSRLLSLQQTVRARGEFPVLILVSGMDAAGKGETINLLNEWMDPRYMLTEAFGSELDGSPRRPRMWRYWNRLPPRGHIGVLFGAWYTNPLSERMSGLIDAGQFEQSIEQIQQFEGMLIAEGALVIKLWFHLSRKDQRKRLQQLSKDPDTAWRVSDRDWQHCKQYDRYLDVATTLLRKTGTEQGPWHVIPGADSRYRSVVVAKQIADKIEARLNVSAPPTRRSIPLLDPATEQCDRDILDLLDYQQSLSAKQYKSALAQAQSRISRLSRDARMHKHSLILVFEGMDAAGKGSTIRRLTAALDARFYRVHAISAPSDEERAQPYLWRFWRRVPEQGSAAIFDRSWYGRVLVERVEGFCTESDWRRAYAEINDFEQQLTDHGAVVLKFWLSVTLEEQLARFRAREQTPHKRHKITDEDWRNRDRWPDYADAVCDMVAKTSTAHAPWTLVPANDKKYARVTVLNKIADAVETRFQHRGAL